MDHYGVDGKNRPGDETWIHHYEPESKRQSVQWKHLHLPAKKKFKMHPTAARLMLTVFWDSQGLLLEHYQRGVSAVNNACYSGVLCDKLKPAIWSKRWGLLSDGVVLLPDSASPHTAAHTVETLKKLNFEVLRYWSNHCLVLTLPLETVTCLNHLNKP